MSFFISGILSSYLLGEITIIQLTIHQHPCGTVNRSGISISLSTVN